MGCGAGTAQRPASGAGAGGQFSARSLAEDAKTSVTEVEKVIAHPRVARVTKLELLDNFWSSSEDGFTATDPSGAKYMEVKMDDPEVREKIHLFDPKTGARICMLQEKVIGNSINDRCTFQIYTYEAKDEEQSWTETDDGVPVYRYAVIHQTDWKFGRDCLGDQYDVHLYLNNMRKHPPLFSAFRETWHWEWDSKVYVFKGDQVDRTNGALDKCEIVSKFGVFDESWWGDATGLNRYGIEMATGCDPVLHACLAIACDAQDPQRRRKVSLMAHRVNSNRSRPKA